MNGGTSGGAGPGRRRFLVAGLSAVAGLGAAAGVRAATAHRTGGGASASGGGAPAPSGGPATGSTPAGRSPLPGPGAAPESAPGSEPGATPRQAPERTAYVMYVGTYTSSGGGKGIGLVSYDPAAGALTARGTVSGVADPSFLALSPSGGHLYAADERPDGAVTAVDLSGAGGPRVLGSRPTGGQAPCHLSVHPGGRHVLTANYGSGSVSVHPLAGDGALLPRSDLVRHSGSGPDPRRQDGPHVHMVLTDPAGRFVLAVDLGTDLVHTYRLAEATGTLTAVSRAALAPGTGPRHLAFHPSGRYAYVVGELGDSVTVCRYDPATGTLSPGAPQPTVPAGARGPGRNYPAGVLVSADGGYAYVSNRGHDSLARFAVTDGGAALRLLDATPSGGAYPRHIAFGPSGELLFAANQNSGTVTAFHVDRRTGRLTPAGASLATPSPVCVLPA